MRRVIAIAAIGMALFATAASSQRAGPYYPPNYDGYGKVIVVPRDRAIAPTPEGRTRTERRERTERTEPLKVEASELPRFDVQSHCTRVASFSGQMSETTLGGCLDREQAVYDALKSTWDELSQAVRLHCLRIATFGGPGSYSTLQGCIRREIAAGQRNQQRQFRY
jgi:hypothetical protein